VTPKHPDFDPELIPILEDLYRLAPVTVTPENLAANRQDMINDALSLEDLRRGGEVEVSERSVPGPDGAPEVSLLILRPHDMDSPLPGIYHTHGGGMIMGNNRGGGLEALVDWITDPGAVIVSVEYRLAPEHPFPAGFDDCYAGLVWTAAHAGELGIDPARLLVAGGSAGGGLAAALALKARDDGGPQLVAQLLIYPMLDDRCGSPSNQELVGEGVWDGPSNVNAWTMLLGDRRGGADVSPYAAPARADDLSGLPPAFIDLGSVDVLRDEDVDYAKRIWSCGGNAELHVWPGGFHAFDVLAPESTLSKAAFGVRTEWLSRVLRDS
jgi:acetyl esterase/lipase